MRTDFTFPSSNGHDTIHAVKWLPNCEPKAVIQLSHGMTEYMKNYDEFAAYLNEQGFAVVGMDYIGHGLTAPNPKELGYFYHYDSSEFLILDIRQLSLYVQESFPKKKHILLGHSFGSFLNRIYASRYFDIDALILVGTGMLNLNHVQNVSRLTLLRKNHRGGYTRSKLIQGYAFARQVRKFLPMKTNYDWISRDEEKVREYISDPKNNYVFTLHGFNTLFKTVIKAQDSSVIENTPNNLPILIISGDDDAIGNYGKGTTKLYELMKDSGKSRVTLKLYKDARHNLLQETNRKEAFKYISDFCMRI